jgi:hypothetical protein
MTMLKRTYETLQADFEAVIAEFRAHNIANDAAHYSVIVDSDEESAIFTTDVFIDNSDSAAAQFLHSIQDCPPIDEYYVYKNVLILFDDDSEIRVVKKLALYFDLKYKAVGYFVPAQFL